MTKKKREAVIALAIAPAYRPPTEAQARRSVKEAAESTMERLKFLGLHSMRPGDLLVESYVKVPVKQGLLELALLHPERMSSIVVEPFYGGYRLLDGHHRLEAIQEVGLRMIWVVVAEVVRTRRGR